MAELRVIYGFHAIHARLRRGAGNISEMYFDAGRSDARMRTLLEALAAAGVRAIAADAGRLQGLSGTHHHQGVVARVTAPALAHDVDDLLDALDVPAMLLLLDGVQDPHNLGACLRVADAFGAHAVIAPKDRAVGLNATVAKVASGAAETVPYIVVTNLARTMKGLRERGVWLVGADQDGESDLYSVRLEGGFAWVLGAEGAGLRRLTRENCDQRVRIPMVGSVESLNVSVAAGVCLYEGLRQRTRGPI